MARSAADPGTEAPMRLSRASWYALTALAHLAEGEGRPLASHAIARARGLPAGFLTKTLKPLVAAGVLLGERGPRGGYRLARPTATITLLEVIETVDGPVRGEAPPVGAAGDALDARLQEVCGHLAELTRRRLGKVRLSDLAGGG
jgi:Rrf2 family protein